MGKNLEEGNGEMWGPAVSPSCVPSRCFRITLSWELGWLSEEPSDPAFARKLREGRAISPPNISLSCTASGTGARERDPASLPVTTCHCASCQPCRPLIKVTAPGGLPGREILRGMARTSHPHTFIALSWNKD